MCEINNNADGKAPKETQTEQIRQIPIKLIQPFKNHPFAVLDDELMQQTIDSILHFGVLNPVIIRPLVKGGYEMVAGHRRMRAAELAGKETLPAIVRQLDDDEAVILMVDSNLQRETILPSERAKAYKMKLEAIKRRAGRPSKENRDQVGHNSFGKRSIDIMAENSPDSRNQIQRFIRLAELKPELMEMVDSKQLAFSPAVELSFLSPNEQEQFMDAMEYSQSTPSLAQAQRLKKLSREGKCTKEAMYEIMSEEKKEDLDRITLTSDTLRKYFPRNFTPKQMEQVILKLLAQWQKNRQRRQER